MTLPAKRTCYPRKLSPPLQFPRFLSFTHSYSSTILVSVSYGVSTGAHTTSRGGSCLFGLYLCFIRSKLYVDTKTEVKGCSNGSQYILLTSHPTCSDSESRDEGLVVVVGRQAE